MKLRIQERWTLGTTAALGYLSGAVLFVLSRFIRIETPVGEQHLPAEHWLRIAHVTFGFGILLGIGYLLKGHILPGLRAHTPKRYRSGIVNLTLFGCLAATALMTLYAGESEWLSWAALAHSLLGLGLPLAILVHGLKRFRAARALKRHAPKP